MLNGGPAVQWARRVLPEPGSALFVSGYQDEESPGRALLGLPAAGGTFTFPDHGDEVNVPLRVRVETMRLSVHADRRGLLDIADEVAARRSCWSTAFPGVSARSADPPRPWPADGGHRRTARGERRVKNGLVGFLRPL
ncbi:hypothetical protein [Actinomadura sp. 3N407]|uniref:hypothetical protein n=1 Tax=Actinomadura sp. 3N407 TaxID=3457423 RepID=UPI003FCECCB4